jgi:histidyl-tRNA synthetase
MATNSLKSIRGMHDITPAQMPAWHRLEKAVSEIFSAYGYGEIRIPLLEKTELFSRAIGEETDVVDKEMYTFEDRSGDSVSLRPEGTAGVVRAVLQSGLLYGSPLRLWYMGPMFRYERPQRGRMRQFHQIGAEVFGAPGPDIDAELLALCRDLWTELGLQNVRLEINSLGMPEERLEFQRQLVEYFSQHRDVLDDESLRRLDRNPFRLMDSKNAEIQSMMEHAPELNQFLGDESKAHFEALCKLLDRLDLEYTISPRLVRGLDYYSHSVFEWITDDLGAQGTVCGGGRYDGLVALQGGKPWPGVGFAMGMERLVELINQTGETSERPVDAYLVMAGEAAQTEGLVLAHRLRREVKGLRLECNLGGGSFKSQFKRADRSGAMLALVLGEDELENSTVVVKQLRKQSPQQTLTQEELPAWLMNWLPER